MDKLAYMKASKTQRELQGVVLGQIPSGTIPKTSLTPALQSELNGLGTALAESMNQIATKRDKTVKLGQADMTEEFLQQMAGTTPINSVPADKSVTPKKTDFINVSPHVNVFDKSTVTLNSIMSASPSSYTGAFYSERIPVKAGDIVRSRYKSTFVSNAGHVYKADGTRISTIVSLPGYTVINNEYWQATMPTDAAYIIINGWMAEINVWMTVLNVEYPTEYVSFGTDYALQSKIKTSYENLDDTTKAMFSTASNVLYGKKYVACGDSVTHGANADLDGSGNRKNYQYYIGKRNNMNIITNAISGSTMANVSGKNPFSVDRYKQLGINIDYITLWFGINDSSYANLGTISDTDNTTFYGAWNIVMEYLITNYPSTKIGIIVTYNGTQTFRDAIRAIAKKWAVPMLDFMGDANVPMISGRETGFGLSDTAKTLRKNTFLADGTHPNDVGYQYISTVVENFLRSL